nr:methyl-accepting chemotaxis protein [Ectobacillus antri]
MNIIRNLFAKQTIGKKLLFPFFAIFIIAGVAIGGISYTETKDSLEKEILRNAKVNVDVLENVISRDIENKFNDLNIMTATIGKSTYETEEGMLAIKVDFNKYIKLHSEIQSVYTGGENGTFAMMPMQQLPSGYNHKERPWYKQAMEKPGEIIITDPYKDAVTGDTVITLAKKTTDGSGVVAIDFNVKSIKKLASQVKVGKEGYVSIFTGDKKVIVHPTLKPGTVVDEDFMNTVYKKTEGILSYTYQGQERKMTFQTDENTGWKIIGTMYDKEVSDAAGPTLFKILIVIGASVVIGGVGIYLLIMTVTRPLKRLLASSQKISEGDLTETIVVRSSDEVGQLATSFNEMAQSLRTLISQINASAGMVAASSEELTASVIQANETTQQITHAMEQVSSGVEHQTKSVAAGMELLQEVTNGIQRVSEGSAVISESSVYTKQKAQSGGTMVKETVTQMQSIHRSVHESDAVIGLLNEKSKQIGAILEAIKGIADQTNLLALNAAIEAARAGEHGRGFAIVADEVRKLAEQSASSSNEIGKLINEIQQDVHLTVSTMKQVNNEVQSGLQIALQTEQSFEEILKSTETIATQVEGMVITVQRMTMDSINLEAAVNEIAAAANENASGTQRIASASEEQSASIKEMNDASIALSEMAEELQNMIGRFKI